MLNRKQGLRIYALPFALLGAAPKPTNAKVSQSYGRETFCSRAPVGRLYLPLFHAQSFENGVFGALVENKIEAAYKIRRNCS